MSTSKLVRKIDKSPKSEKKKLIIVPKTMTEPQCATFRLTDEDHTLGNALRWTLMKNSEVDFASYSIPHPSETATNIRVQTSEKSSAVEAMLKGLDDLSNICRHVINSVQVELAKGEFEYEEESAM